MNLAIPNILTISRIFFSFLLLALIIYGYDMLPSYVHHSWMNYLITLVFIVASVTDFFDGYIARAYKQTTVFGEIFDPLADKMLLLSAFVGLLVLGHANPWAIFLILSREFFITGLRVVAASKGSSVAASNLGKYKTGVQITAVAFLLMDWFPGDILLWIATIITLYSGYDYVKEYYKKG